MLSLDDVKVAVKDALDLATISSGISVGISNDVSDVDRIMDELLVRSPALHSSLKKFKERYSDWINFHQRVEKMNCQGALTHELSEEQVLIHEDLETARREFLTLLRSCPVK